LLTSGEGVGCGTGHWQLLATAEKHLGAYKDVVMDNVAKVIPAAKPAAGGASAAPPEPKTE